MAADFDTFKIMFPELVACADGNKDAIEFYIQQAVNIIGQPTCPKISDSLILSMSAHFVAKSGHNPEGANDSPGPATSQSVGSVSISYQVPTATEGSDMKSYYQSTTYGQQYLMYNKYCYGTGAMVAP